MHWNRTQLSVVEQRQSVSSVHSLDRFGGQEDMMDGSTETLFWSFLQEAIQSSSGMDGEWWNVWQIPWRHRCWINIKYDNQPATTKRTAKRNKTPNDNLHYIL